MKEDDSLDIFMASLDADVVRSSRSSLSDAILEASPLPGKHTRQPSAVEESLAAKVAASPYCDVLGRHREEEADNSYHRRAKASCAELLVTKPGDFLR